MALLSTKEMNAIDYAERDNFQDGHATALLTSNGMAERLASTCHEAPVDSNAARRIRRAAALS
jgi:hypothetical protein